MKFRAMVIRESGDGKFTRLIEERDISELPEGEVLINVKYSSLNYKDALSSIGNRGVTKKYPHTPGIDAAGIVVETSSSRFKKGDEVLATGYDLGMNTSGGFAEYLRVPAAWLAKRPDGLSLRETMIYGTAGFTAALSLYKLAEYGDVKPSSGRVLVTGARGGVGSHAVRFLSNAGYSVTAVTGIHTDPEKEFPEDERFLKNIGASEVISKDQVDDTSGKPMLKALWAGVIDSVGGNILSTAVRQTVYGGAVTSCGNAAGADFYANVYPFILRGISLFGIDSVECPLDFRVKIWEKMAGEWKGSGLESMAVECSLDEAGGYIDRMLRGDVKKRVIINITG